MKYIFSFFLLLTLFLILPGHALMHEESEGMSGLSATGAAAVMTPTPTPNYLLPYPGMLPDNPLYMLKAMRDRVINFLIADSQKKAEFYLLQSDKRLNAGWYLFQQGKKNLAQSTISKGETYFDQAVSEAQAAQTEGVDVKDLLAKMVTSSEKHQQILMQMANKSNTQDKVFYESLDKKSDQLQKRVKKLLK